MFMFTKLAHAQNVVKLNRRLMNDRNRRAEDIIKHVKPISADLSSDALLEKYLHELTQNQNESFNGTVWNRIP